MTITNENEPQSRRHFFSKVLKKTGGITINEVERQAEKVARRYVRPPGASTELDFLSHCTRCGECIPACPHGTIFPLGAHTGVAVNTPALDLINKACHLCDDFPCISACETDALNLILKEDLDQIKIHVSGFTNKVHQIEHRLGNVELIKENMINLSKKVRLHKSRLIVLVDYILYEHNKHELEQFRRFAKALGFGFNIRPGNNKGMEDTEKAHIRIDVTDMPCEWLWKVMAINWNGDLLPCCDYVTWSNTAGFARYINKSGKDLDHYTNTTSSITKTWNGEKVIKMRRVHRTDGRKPIPICSGCSKTGVEYKY